MSRALLEVRDLRTWYFTRAGVVRAVDGVSFEIGYGEAFGLLGETGCGKSTVGLSILGLVKPPGRVVGGQILLEGRDLLRMRGEELEEVRGKIVAMVFQNPLNSLNPVYRIGFQIGEALEVREGMPRERVREVVLGLLRRVGMADAEYRARQYPHQLSGGMRQRSLIAMMVSRRPKLLIADEPTTALDVTIQRQVMDLLDELRREMGMSLLLISHNFGLIAEMCDRAAVMYAGKIVEVSDVYSLFEEPLHPYTRGLIECLPGRVPRKGRLGYIPGFLPSLVNPPPGCRFHPRCRYATERCRREEPRLIDVGGSLVACHLYGGERGG